MPTAAAQLLRALRCERGTDRRAARPALGDQLDRAPHRAARAEPDRHALLEPLDRGPRRRLARGLHCFPRPRRQHATAGGGISLRADAGHRRPRAPRPSGEPASREARSCTCTDAAPASTTSFRAARRARPRPPARGNHAARPAEPPARRLPLVHRATCRLSRPGHLPHPVLEQLAGWLDSLPDASTSPSRRTVLGGFSQGRGDGRMRSGSARGGRDRRRSSRYRASSPRSRASRSTRDSRANPSPSATVRSTRSSRWASAARRASVSREAGADVLWRESPVPHTIDPEFIPDLREFVSRAVLPASGAALARRERLREGIRASAQGGWSTSTPYRGGAEVDHPSLQATAVESLTPGRRMPAAAPAVSSPIQPVNIGSSPAAIARSSASIVWPRSCRLTRG